ncbi:hypothetical protein [Roseibium sp.]|uniref:hypothetical protein n=1 Tax=Roseibium sp. TaxID=1936156 RepID=UPI003A96E5CE
MARVGPFALIAGDGVGALATALTLLRIGILAVGVKAGLFSAAEVGAALIRKRLFILATPTTSLYCCRTDILIKEGALRFRTATDQKGSQHAIGNAARIWTTFWLTVKGMGLKHLKSPIYRSSRLLHVTLKPGTRTCPGDWTFNPNFPDWLMGWPIGWSDPAQPATELSRWLRHMRGKLSRLLIL